LPCTNPATELPSATAAGFFFDLSGHCCDLNNPKRILRESPLLDRLTMPHDATLTNRLLWGQISKQPTTGIR